MKVHTQDFKNELKKLGRQLDAEISYGNTVLKEELFAITPHFEANLLKSVMKQLDIESSVNIPLNTVVNCKIGLKVGNNYEMLDYGNYIIFSSEKQEDTNTYKIIAYDKMLYSMKEYKELNLTYPITIYDYLSSLTNEIGLELANQTFNNASQLILSDLYKDLGYTYRDILDEIAQVSGSIICINNQDKLEIRYPTETYDTIDEEYLRDVNVNFGEMYGPINTVILSRAGGSDKIVQSIPADLPDEQKIAIEIEENQIMNFNNRANFIPGILDAVYGTYYYVNDFNSIGIMYYEVGDLYNIEIGQNTYKCIMLNDEINIKSGIEEIIHTERPEESNTNYSKTDKTDQRINQTYMIVDKQNQTIESVVNNVENQNSRITQAEQDLQGFANIISEMEDQTERVNRILETIEGWEEILQQRGGNNIFFYDKDFWYGETTEDEANLEEEEDITKEFSVSGMGYIINQGWSKQHVTVNNDTYTISFIYKKLKNLATGYVLINGERYDLTETYWKNFEVTLDIDTSTIDLEIYSDTDEAFELFDLLGNVGAERQRWTQNPNETRTDTVTIGKGIQVNSSTTNTYTRIDADGNRIYNSRTNQIIMETTDKGVTATQITTNLASIAGILIQQIDGQTWISGLL